MRKLGKAQETLANKQIPRIKGEELVTINDHMQMPVVEKQKWILSMTTEKKEQCSKHCF